VEYILDGKESGGCRILITTKKGDLELSRVRIHLKMFSPSLKYVTSSSTVEKSDLLEKVASSSARVGTSMFLIFRNVIGRHRFTGWVYLKNCQFGTKGH